MIEAGKMIQKLGKEKFVDFVLHNKDKERTGAERQHDGRWGKGSTCFQICEHQKVTIRDFKQTGECPSCNRRSAIGESAAVVVHSHEYFNAGTGTYGTTSEHRKFAKSKGLMATA